MRKDVDMVIKSFVIIGALLIALMSASSMRVQADADSQPNTAAATAGQTTAVNETRGVRVYLKCEVSGSGKATHLQITNNTSNKIGKGTKVYWEINPYDKGSFVLPGVLVPGGSYRLTVETQSLLPSTTGRGISNSR